MSHRPNAQKVVAPIRRIWTAFWNEAPFHLIDSVRNWFITVENWLLDSKKATYGLAVTRILFSITALGLLASNFSTRFYTFGSGSAWTGELAAPKSEFPNIWLFSLFHRVVENDVVFTLLYLLVAALAFTVLIGYRTRLLLPVFWVLWVSLIELQDMVSDQGDNIFRIALFGMLFADTSGRWSVDEARRKRNFAKGNVLTRLWHGAPVFSQPLVNMAHNLVVVTLTCQVVFIYVSGALYKAGGKPWQDGTAVYAPLHVTRFAPWPELSEMATAWAPAVAAMSIGSVLIQLFFPGALLFRWTRIPILFAMIGFHAGIGLFMGLPWFSLAMVAIDSIFVRDVTWQRIEDWCKKAVREQPEASPGEVDIARPQENPSEMREFTKSESSDLLDAGRR
ncbi:HTTM domain-containing protein [Paeniglutamicibacter sp. MACA_103]|uniref:HTTM domain-containing protein n=1 Tax=Paeniglutamicibacter sp. MACA_103 TaxID=3377337 RepID=UPI003893FC80